MAYGNPKGIIAGSMVSELLATTCVGLRFYSRYRAKAHVIASDWVILAAVLIGTGLTVLEIYGTSILDFFAFASIRKAWEKSTSNIQSP